MSGRWRIREGPSKIKEGVRKDREETGGIKGGENERSKMINEMKEGNKTVARK